MQALNILGNEHEGHWQKILLGPLGQLKLLIGVFLAAMLFDETV